MPYTYLGRLAYLTHDAERQSPVHFQWQLVDQWPPPDAVLQRMGLQLVPATPVRDEPGIAVTMPASISSSGSAYSAIVELGGLRRTDAPEASSRGGIRTADFTARRAPDRSWQDARNRSLGSAGEKAVVALEQHWLRQNGREDLANLVRHVSVVDGDGTGYDVASFDLDGKAVFIEVKTTRGGIETAFFISSNELEFSISHSQAFRLYRLYEFEPESGSGGYYVLQGPLTQVSSMELQPIQFRESNAWNSKRW